MSDRTTFRLPGHELNPLAERKCLLSLVAAYSKKWNPRNLEAPWYEAWAHIFADLVAGHPSLSVAPQPYLWYDPTLQAHTTPGPVHLLSTEDEQLDELLDDVGNISMDSLRSLSVPHHRNRSRIPDFAITRKVSFLRPYNTSQVMFLDRKVTYLGIPLLIELKSPGARCGDIQTSLSNAMVPIGFARDQLSKQAYHLFQMYPHQESVILIAVSGFWWSYCIFSRDSSEALGLHKEGEEDDADVEMEMDVEADTRLPHQNGIHDILAQNPGDSNEMSMEALQERLYGFPLGTLHDTVHLGFQFHTVLPHDQMSLRKKGWSRLLLYGTAPSNQVLSLILDRLRSVVHVHYDGRMG